MSTPVTDPPTDGALDPRYCGAKNRAGTGCRRPAGWGTPHVGHGRCKLHGGNTPSGRQYGRRVAARAEVDRLGLEVRTDPLTALENELALAYGMVAYLGDRVAELQREELTGPVGQDDDSHHPKGAPHVWIVMLGEERDRLLRVIKVCVDLGMESKRMEQMERMGAWAGEFARFVLTEFGLLADPRAQDVVRRGLMLLEGKEAAP